MQWRPALAALTSNSTITLLGHYCISERIIDLGHRVGTVIRLDNLAATDNQSPSCEVRRRTKPVLHPQIPL
jgi:hypothetical protein